jgi:hypothetical protein
LQNKELSTINSKLSTVKKFIKIKKAEYERMQEELKKYEGGK